MRSPQFFVCLRPLRGSVPRLVVIALVVSAQAAAVAQPTANRAGKPQAPSTRPAEARYWLRVTGEGVNMRSRADLNSRIVGRVSRDDVLEAVGSEYSWHRIVPPEGVFSLVSASYIERRDAQRGIVRVNTTLRVRVGSDIQPRDPMVSEVQTRLPRDAEVRIIGALDGEWLKIVPPEGVYVYISGDYVERISAEVANRLRVARSAGSSQPSGAVTARPRAGVAVTTQPVERPDLTGRWGQQLEQALAAIQSEAGKSAHEQSWAAIMSRLRPIGSQREEPQVAKLAAAWIEKLKQRTDDQAVLRTAHAIARRVEQDTARHARELQKMRREADALLADREFDARGVLRASFALPAGPYGLRYSLQDPFTHKVQAYAEFPTELGVDVRACLGKYVGVRGQQQSAKGVGAPLLRVTHITVLNPDRPTSRPAREKP